MVKVRNAELQPSQPQELGWSRGNRGGLEAREGQLSLRSLCSQGGSCSEKRQVGAMKEGDEAPSKMQCQCLAHSTLSLVQFTSALCAEVACSRAWSRGDW